MSGDSPHRHNDLKTPKGPIWVPPDKKFSPNSLLRVLQAVRQTADRVGVKRPKFLELLQEEWKRAGSRYQVSVITDQIFKACERGKSPLFYWEIEAYAHQAKVPSAVFLIISRLTQHKRHVLDKSARRAQRGVGPESPEAITAGMLALLDHYANTVDAKTEITDWDIRSMIDAYQNAAKLKAIEQHTSQEQS
jgi:hypothetical protein